MRLGFALLLVVSASRFSAAQAEPPARAVSIYRATQSPFCPGRTLDDCPSPDAARWRADIRDWLDEGASGPEIRSRLQERVPGFDLSGREGVPGLVFAFGGFALVALALGWRLKRTSVSPSNLTREPQRDDALDERLDEELAQHAD